MSNIFYLYYQHPSHWRFDKQSAKSPNKWNLHLLVRVVIRILVDEDSRNNLMAILATVCVFPVPKGPHTSTGPGWKGKRTPAPKMYLAVDSCLGFISWHSTLRTLGNLQQRHFKQIFVHLHAERVFHRQHTIHSVKFVSGMQAVSEARSYKCFNDHLH